MLRVYLLAWKSQPIIAGRGQKQPDNFDDIFQAKV